MSESCGCEVCLKVDNKNYHPELQPIKTTESLVIVRIDLVGCLTESRRRSKYFTCLFSKFILAFPIADKTGTSIAEKLEMVINM